MSNSEHVTVQQAAEILHESRPTTARRVAKGELPSEKLDGRLGMYLIKRADVEKLRDRILAELEQRVDSMKATSAS